MTNVEKYTNNIWVKENLPFWIYHNPNFSIYTKRSLMDIRIVNVWQWIRDFTGRPVHINNWSFYDEKLWPIKRNLSGYRPPQAKKNFTELSKLINSLDEETLLFNSLEQNKKIIDEIEAANKKLDPIGAWLSFHKSGKCIDGRVEGLSHFEVNEIILDHFKELSELGLTTIEHTDETTIYDENGNVIDGWNHTGCRDTLMPKGKLLVVRK